MFFYYLDSDNSGKVIPLPDDFLLTDFYNWKGISPHASAFFGKYNVTHFYCEYRNFVFMTGVCTYTDYLDLSFGFCSNASGLENIGKYVAFISGDNTRFILFSSDNFKDLFKIFFDYLIDNNCQNSGNYPTMQNKSWGWGIANSYQHLDSAPYNLSEDLRAVYGLYSMTHFHSDFSFSVVPCCELDYSPIVKFLGGTPA